jgi:hypothetical protein
MSAIIFWFSWNRKDKYTVIEDGQAIWRSEWGLVLSNHANQVAFVYQLHDLKRSTEVSLMSKGKGVRTINFEADRRSQCHKGVIGIEAH